MTDQEGFGRIEKERVSIPWKLIALVAVAAGLVIFFAQNSEDTEIRFLWLDATTPTWVVIGISVAIGVALTRLGTWQWRRARKRKQPASD